MNIVVLKVNNLVDGTLRDLEIIITIHTIKVFLEISSRLFINNALINILLFPCKIFHLFFISIKNIKYKI